MIFITGSTGFLGRELVGRLLVAEPHATLALLVRSGNSGPAEARVRELLDTIFGDSVARHYRDRVEVVEGDLLLPRFGLGDTEFDALASRVDRVFHCAASTTLDQPLNTAREINVGGTVHALSLAERAGSLRSDVIPFYHVSTAYVAGATERTVRAEELSSSISFRNAYERSKAEAEVHVRASSEAVHDVVFRPSVIVGDSVTGETSAFNVIYVPSKFLVKGLFHILPAAPDAPFDIVPVDYVADAMVELSRQQRAAGDAFHLCAGVGRESSPIEILDMLFDTFYKYGYANVARFSKPRFLPLEVADLTQRSVLKALEGIKHLEKVFVRRIGLLSQLMPYIPYMTGNPQFDVTATNAALRGTVGEAPLFSSYAERVFGYCAETNWGKSPWTNPHELTPWFARVSSAQALA